MIARYINVHLIVIILIIISRSHWKRMARLTRQPCASLVT